MGEFIRKQARITVQQMSENPLVKKRKLPKQGEVRFLDSCDPWVRKDVFSFISKGLGEDLDWRDYDLELCAACFDKGEPVAVFLIQENENGELVPDEMFFSKDNAMGLKVMMAVNKRMVDRYPPDYPVLLVCKRKRGENLTRKLFPGIELEEVE